MSETVHPRPIAGAYPRTARLLGDELLARLVGRGSNHAFAVLCERHAQALHRYCRSILRDEHDAQDALQSTMTQAYAALRARERDVSLRAWLFRIAHNESVTILRRRARHSGGGSESTAHASDPHSVLEQRARLNQLIADLQALPERQRATLVMRELSGLGVREIAQALGISPAAAKQSLFEARNSLRDFDRGREMECHEVRSAISAHDRRILRGRRISAHLNNCESCRGYRNAIGVREAELRALAPALPVSAIGATLARALGLGRLAVRSGSASAPDGSSQELLAHASASALIKIGASVAVIAAGAAGGVRIVAKPAQPRPVSSSAAAATRRVAYSARSTGASGNAQSAVARAAGAGQARPLRPSSIQAPAKTAPVLPAAKLAPASSRIAPPGSSPAAQAQPSNERARTDPAGQSAGSQVDMPESAASKREQGHGEEDAGSGQGEHGPSSAEQQNRNEHGERPQSSPEHRPAGPESGEQPQPAPQPAHGHGGAGRSEQPGE